MNPGNHEDGPLGNANTLLTQPLPCRDHEPRAYDWGNSQLLLALNERTEEVVSILQKREIFSFQSYKNYEQM